MNKETKTAAKYDPVVPTLQQQTIPFLFNSFHSQSLFQLIITSGTFTLTMKYLI